MRCAFPAGLLLALLVGAAPAGAADDPRVEGLALCRDSWRDWQKTDPAALSSAAAYFRSAFTHKDADAFAVPKSPMTIAGLKVVRMFPESVGMGVGFSVLVDAPFDVAKQAVEQTLGKPLRDCETGEGIRSCDLPIAAERTVTLMAGGPPNERMTLVGCFYLYEK
jgi:hypothetical protein